jgi:hypothetical protein
LSGSQLVLSLLAGHILACPRRLPPPVVHTVELYTMVNRPVRSISAGRYRHHRRRDCRVTWAHTRYCGSSIGRRKVERQNVGRGTSGPDARRLRTRSRNDCACHRCMARQPRILSLPLYIAVATRPPLGGRVYSFQHRSTRFCRHRAPCVCQPRHVGKAVSRKRRIQRNKSLKVRRVRQ